MLQYFKRTFCICRFVFVTPPVQSQMIRMHVSHPPPNYLQEQSNRETMFRTHLSPKTANYHKICTKMTVQFPELRLIQYDCGKYMNEYKTTKHFFKYLLYISFASFHCFLIFHCQHLQYGRVLQTAHPV